MHSAFVASRGWIHACVVLLLAATICTADEPPAPPAVKTILQVQLKVIEVQTDKLKNLGFSWTHVASEGKVESFANFLDSLKKAQSVDELNGFLEALAQNGLARVQAEPTISTLNGRPASLRTGGTRLDMVPILLANGDVRLECRLEIDATPVATKRTSAKPDAEKPATPFQLDTATELAVGKTTVIGHARNRNPAAESRSRETETVVLARVDLLNSVQTR